MKVHIDIVNHIPAKLHFENEALGEVQKPCFSRYTDELHRPAFSGKINVEYESI